MSKRPPNELEAKLHQAALSAPKQEISARQTEKLIPDATARQTALNFLLGVGLFKSLKDAKGNLSFRAVSKGELTATKDLSGEESLVLGHIKTSHTEGIWTKHLKAKTNLHQTIIDRCLKTLIQKKLIKRVPSVQHPTRKIYMLDNLEPSIALTGGPWYTDNELDTEFIQHLTDACLKFIRDLSFPKRRSHGKDGVLFPISNSPQYPTAEHIRNSLRQARLTETDLSVEHVEMLLNVLVLDGEIEKLPAFGGALWDSSAIDNGEFPDEQERRSKKKRRRYSDSDESGDHKLNKKKRKKKKHMSEDESSDSEDEQSQKKRKKRRRAKDESDSESDSDEDLKTKKKKKKKKKESESDDTSSDEPDSPGKRKKPKKPKKPRSSSEGSSSESESDHRRRRNRKSSKSTKRSSSPGQLQPFDGFDSAGGGHVYRAIKQERLSLGWSQSPCSTCPSFEFCKDGGPVNPRECVYYGDWLIAGTVTAIEEG
ncbi:RNA polymerase Rpc34 [Infundibulicybe gibba]|nr:RNA polymerase Rpc34 [Infundibulicybe gibba]